jgi:3-hydroxyisobutyrate dehydrogenase-like beta-hydroxyacid dehydrogenase
MDKETIQVETIGFIGLGNMGMGMAGNIQKADYRWWFSIFAKP